MYLLSIVALPQQTYLIFIISYPHPPTFIFHLLLRHIHQFIIIFISQMGVGQTRQQKAQYIHPKADQQTVIQKVGFRDQDIKNFNSQKTIIITKLILRGDGITAQGVMYFQEKNWSNLTLLSLSRNCIGDLGCKLLTQATMKCLTYLNLTKNMIAISGGLHLLKSNWKDMKQFNLNNNRIWNINCLSKGNWKSIIALELCSNQIQFAYVLDAIFIESNHMVSIYLTLNKFTENDRERNKVIRLIRQKFPIM